MDDQERRQALLDDAERLPFEARIPILEEALALADASGDESAQIAVRVRLAQAYEFGGTGDRAAETIDWLLRRLDAKRLDDEDTFHVLWMNKWLVGSLLERPEVGLAEVRAAVAAMRSRYRRHKQPLQPVLKASYYLERHVRGDAGAGEAYEAWVSAERSDLSDCEACEPSTMAGHLAALGRHAEAVAAAERVLNGELGCAEEPEEIVSILLPSLVLLGRGGEVAELHALSWRGARDRSGATGTVARLIGFCARTHNLARSVELLRARWSDLDAAPSPEHAMEFAAHASRLAGALVEDGQGDLEIVPGVRAADLAPSLRERALTLAGAFDRRNGTSAVGDRVRAALDADDLGPVDLGAVRRYPLGEVLVPDRSSMPGSPDLRTLDLTDPGVLVAAIDAADRWGGEAELLKLSAAWEEIRVGRLAALTPSTDVDTSGTHSSGTDSSGTDAAETLPSGATSSGTDAAGAHWSGADSSSTRWTDADTDALRIAALLEVRSHGALRAGADDERLANAADLYRRAGLIGQALLVEQRKARIRGDADAVRASLTAIDRIGTVEEVLQAQLAMLRATDDPDEASLLADAILAATPAARESWRVRGVVAATCAERITGDPTLALAVVEQGFGVLEGDELPDERGALLLARGVLLVELDRLEEAMASLLEAGRLAWDAGCPSLWAQALTYRALTARAGDDLAATEELLAEASVAAAASRQWQPAGQLTLDQAATLAAMERPVQAAEMAERALAHLTEPSDRAWAASAAAGYAGDIGDLTRAREFAAMAVREHATLGPSPNAFGALGELGHLQWRQDDDAVALATFDAALGQARLLDDPHAETFAHWWRSKALATLGEADEALAALDAADSALTRTETELLTDSDLRDRIDSDDVARLRRVFRASRARALGLTERYADALAALGDPADWAPDDDRDEIRQLAELLEADLAEQQAREDEDKRKRSRWWQRGR